MILKVVISTKHTKTVKLVSSVNLLFSVDDQLKSLFRVNDQLKGLFSVNDQLKGLFSVDDQLKGLFSVDDQLIGKLAGRVLSHDLTISKAININKQKM